MLVRARVPYMGTPQTAIVCEKVAGSPAPVADRRPNASKA
jgi:hypothetical protein